MLAAEGMGMQGNQAVGTVTGVVRARTGGVAGLTIEAWSVSAIAAALDAPLATAVVAHDGAFSLPLDDAHVASGRMMFRFFAGPQLVASLEHELGRGPLALELVAAPEAAPPVGPVHAVRGVVRAADGTAIVGARVGVFQKELRRET